ncbi:hypothetical protein MKX03_016293, partial [Papaver bracteatum]
MDLHHQIPDLSKDISRLARKLCLSLLLHIPFYVQLRAHRLQQSILIPVPRQSISQEKRNQAETDTDINIANSASQIIR